MAIITKIRSKYYLYLIIISGKDYLFYKPIWARVLRYLLNCNLCLVHYYCMSVLPWPMSNIVQICFPSWYHHPPMQTRYCPQTSLFHSIPRVSLLFRGLHRGLGDYFPSTQGRHMAFLKWYLIIKTAQCTSNTLFRVDSVGSNLLLP